MKISDNIPKAPDTYGVITILSLVWGTFLKEPRYDFEMIISPPIIYRVCTLRRALGQALGM